MNVARHMFIIFRVSRKGQHNTLVCYWATRAFEDLRASLMERQREALTRKNRSDASAFAFSHEIFAHVNEYRDVFRAMAGKQSGAAVQQLLHKILLTLVRDDVKATWLRGATAVQSRWKRSHASLQAPSSGC